jgi:hypothetical protein
MTQEQHGFLEDDRVAAQMAGYANLITETSAIDWGILCLPSGAFVCAN